MKISNKSENKEKRQVKSLHIYANEDHVHLQKPNIYLYTDEGKSIKNDLLRTNNIEGMQNILSKVYHDIEDKRHIKLELN